MKRPWFSKCIAWFKRRWILISRYEFWPYWLFYCPLYFYGLYLAIRSGSLTYFSATNRRMKNGGAFGTSKFDILQDIPSDLLPAGIKLDPKMPIKNILKAMKKAGLEFPLIAKPDVGERGKGVELIEDPGSLELYFMESRQDVILQEFIDLPIELGVLYYRYPDGSGNGISSVVIRDFLKVKGTGYHTLKALIEKRLRARLRARYLLGKFRTRLDDILPEGEEFLLEPIGNHNRGTRFLNGNHLINDQLLKVFDGIADCINGFDYGRFDLKITTIEGLYRGEGIKILELNGINSEPAHIYDPAYNLFRAWADIAMHMSIIYRISRMNRKEGVKYTPPRQLYGDLFRHLFH